MMICLKVSLEELPSYDGPVSLDYYTRDDCSKRVQLGDANRVQRMRSLPIGFPGQNRGMHPHQVQLLHAEVNRVHGRVQTHPVFVYFGNYDGMS